MVKLCTSIAMPSSFAGEVVIKTIRKVGTTFGGIIFTCRTTCPKKLRFVVKANHQIARLSKLYRVGHTWYVEGQVHEHIATWNNGEQRAEWQINADKLSFVRVANENLVALLKEISGVGPEKAKNIIKSLGHQLFSIARNSDIDTLSKYCTKTIAERIITDLQNYEALSAVQLLDECGVPAHISNRALNIWGPETYDKICSNPYFLIPFEANLKLIDAFAIGRFNFKPDSPERLEAYVKGTLFDGFDRGNTCLLESNLKSKLTKRLGSSVLSKKALEHAYKNGIAIKIGDLVQVGSMHIIESTIAENILKFKKRKQPKIPESRLHYYLDRYEGNIGFNLTSEQRSAVVLACQSPLMLLAGGAGCGKTTVLEAICFVLEQVGIVSDINLMPLSGKAAQRITESTGREASTIAGFLYHKKKSELDDKTALIVDESSMVDTLSLHQILKRLTASGRVIFAGDEEQIPPVGVGLTLHEMVKMKLPQANLSTVKRQEEASDIPKIANQIRNYPKSRDEICFSEFNGLSKGVSFIETPAKQIQSISMKVYEALGGDGSSNEIVILSPMRSSNIGVHEINHAIHEKFFNSRDEKLIFNDEQLGSVSAVVNTRPVCMGELLMSKRNDYTRDIRNGSVGKVIGYDPNEQTIQLDFNENVVNFHISETPYLEHASAMTIHKSQGSQYKRVIVIVQDCNMMDRHLLYTAITRAEEQVVFIGSKDVFYKKLIVSKALQRNTLVKYYFELQKLAKSTKECRDI